MDKKKRLIVQMEGGLGKQVALSSLIPVFKEKYEEVIVLSSYPAVFQNNPLVYRAISYATPYAYEEYFKNADDIVYPCGYRDSDFRKRRIPLLEAALNSINYKIPNNIKELRPRLDLTATEEEVLQQTIFNLGRYIIVQAHGGKAPGTPTNKNIMVKDYDIHKMEEVVSLLKKEHPDLTVINFSLPDEIEIKGTIKMDFNWPIWFGLIRECESFIAIDSSLQHMSAAFNKKGIVLWGATNPNCFGWEHNVNLTHKCPYNDLHCSRPYFVPSVDIKADGNPWECPSKQCMKFDPAEIVKAFMNNIEVRTDEKPKIDLTNFTSLTTRFVS